MLLRQCCPPPAVRFTGFLRAATDETAKGGVEKHLRTRGVVPKLVFCVGFSWQLLIFPARNYRKISGQGEFTRLIINQVGSVQFIQHYVRLRRLSAGQTTRRGAGIYSLQRLAVLGLAELRPGLQKMARTSQRFDPHFKLNFNPSKFFDNFCSIFSGEEKDQVQF